MYEWSFSLCGLVIVGRKWQEFIDMIKFIEEWFELGTDRHMVIYVHNLSYEFQFIKHYFQWDKVFALKKHKVCRALTTGGIEFRCSYILSGYSLAKLADQLLKYKVKKLVGDLDYNKIRHSKTPLTKEEIGYCVNDVLVVTAYIQETLETREHMYNIPLTQTSYVREYTRKYCFYGGEGKRDNDIYHKYRKFMLNMTLEPDEYTSLKNAFAGGFTHASTFYSGYTMDEVCSFDLKSSYPSQMLKEKFPMSKGERIKITTKQALERNLRAYCCMFDLELWNVKPKILYENYISISHCRQITGAVSNNGRLVSAEHILITVTDVDFKLIEQFYSWEKANIFNFYRYIKAYLPKNFVLSILDLYEKKTALKGVEGKEREYMNSKENLNSDFGMCVTDIVRPDILYEETGEWSEDKPELEDAIKKTNSSAKRFLFYPWGVWITAYARRALFEGITEFGNDYIYSDTDSIKGLNAEKHMKFIDDYNARITEQLRVAMAFHGIPFERTHPKNPKGEPQYIGTWEFEGIYDKFKTLGAKRYMIKKKNALKVTDIKTGNKRIFDYSLTVSGVNKNFAIPYLYDKYGDNIFEAFAEDLIIPKEYTGKMTHTYIDEPLKGKVIDYLGIEGEYNEKSVVHLEEAEYSLSITDSYINYLLQIREELK